ncbi:phosphatidylinositol mannoside acyltransferase [Amycolatopsis antarctica]|uniref:Phosphatidylinositol mannoside acyltransferase n=1 Tax=Amycolatopsis antarctica TaxID=1854586 RepID=A0A263D4A4_9PSEU|nr:phosphatidylinositol mannoside acyltransferase [Amycolatopsis antarctica]OZM72457.1 phosphatidylinositol mannoside acyltransferase [Amycolatopsis antarctica]
MTTTTERLTDLGYATGWNVVRRLPRPVTDAAFGLAADLAARRQGPGTRQLRSNLARVVPQAGPAELDDLVRRGLRSYGRYWQEAFRLPTMDLDEVHRRVDATVSGVENLDAAFEAGNGAILAMTHSGNWDVAGTWLGKHSGTFTTVAERLKPDSLYDRFVVYRETLGFEILPADGGAATFRTLLRRLRENRAVVLLCDRDLSNKGIPVDFFGDRIRIPAGAAKLAATTGAPLLPFTSWFIDDGWGLRVHPRIRVNGPEEVASGTQALADVFAGEIATHPADWHMLQKVWISDLEPASPASTGGAG